MILAGGLGSRFKGHKQTSFVSNQETLMEFALYDALQLGCRKYVLIIHAEFPENYKNRISRILKQHNSEIHFIVQTNQKFLPNVSIIQNNPRKKPLGTAHAVLCAKDVISEPFITMNADDFYGYQSFRNAFQFIQKIKNSSECAMVAYDLEKTLSDSGSVSRGICEVENGYLKSVNEFTEIQQKKEIIRGKNEKGKEEILGNHDKTSMNFWILQPVFFEWAQILFNEFLSKSNNLIDAEFYLPSVIDHAIKEKLVQVSVLETPEKWFGMTYPEDREKVIKEIQERKIRGQYPTELWKF